VRRRAIFSSARGSFLANPMGGTLRQSGRITSVPEPVPKTSRGERFSELRDVEQGPGQAVELRRGCSAVGNTPDAMTVHKIEHWIRELGRMEFGAPPLKSVRTNLLGKRTIGQRLYD
jgi:hypothetical protein